MKKKLSKMLKTNKVTKMNVRHKNLPSLRLLDLDSFISIANTVLPHFDLLQSFVPPSGAKIPEVMAKHEKFSCRAI